MNTRGLLVVLVGALLLGAGFAATPDRAFAACLSACIAAAEVSLGALVLLMISHVLERSFLTLFRRQLEALALALPALGVILTVILVLGLRRIFPWAGDLSDLPEESRKLVEHKQAWL